MSNTTRSRLVELLRAEMGVGARRTRLDDRVLVACWLGEHVHAYQRVYM